MTKHHKDLMWVLDALLAQSNGDAITVTHLDIADASKMD